MGKLSEIFDRDRTKAEDFIEEVKGYLCLNQDIAGFNFPIKKVHFMLTHMKGPKVANWVKTMDKYVSDFEELVRMAGYATGSPETMTMFLDGVNAGILRDIMKPPVPRDYRML